MQAASQIRPLTATDFAAVLALWQRAEGVEIAEGDDHASLATYLERNPGLSRLAECDGEVIGAVLCGHDGRRGLIYHLAVAAEFRGRGLGRRLMVACLDGLRACRIQRALILVAKDNHTGKDFWISSGFEEISGALPLGIDL